MISYLDYYKVGRLLVVRSAQLPPNTQIARLGASTSEHIISYLWLFPFTVMRSKPFVFSYLLINTVEAFSPS